MGWPILWKQRNLRLTESLQINMKAPAKFRRGNLHEAVV